MAANHTLTPPDGETHWEQLWLPLWPLASDDLHAGIYRMDRRSALGCRYVEANPHALSNLLVVDIDHSDARLRALWGKQGYIPNAVVTNPHNGHAHAVWALSEPFTRTEFARRKPLAYAAAVSEGLRRSVDGDRGYSGLITKNPDHKAWEAYWETDHLYQLGELAHHLADNGFMPPPSWGRTKRSTPVGLGRNCTLFETVRTWAYPLVRNYDTRTHKDSQHLLMSIAERANEINFSFTEPLPSSEVRATAASIHRWITTRFYRWIDGAAANDANYSHLQTERGRKSGIARRKIRDATMELL